MFRGIQEAIRQGLENIGKNSPNLLVNATKNLEHGLEHGLQNLGESIGTSILYAALLMSLTTLLVAYKGEMKNMLREYHSSRHAQEQAVRN